MVYHRSWSDSQNRCKVPFDNFSLTRTFLGRWNFSTMGGFYYPPSYEEFHRVTLGWMKEYFEGINCSTFDWVMNSTKLKRGKVFLVKIYPQGTRKSLAPRGGAEETQLFSVRKKNISIKVPSLIWFKHNFNFLDGKMFQKWVVKHALKVPSSQNLYIFLIETFEEFY